MRYEKEEENLFNNIDIELDEGEGLFIHGPTGSGKTSLLKILSGIIPHVQSAIFDGKIFWNGDEITFNQYKRAVSMCFQKPEDQFIFNKTNKELYYNASDRMDNRVDELVEHFGIRDLLKKSVKDLSSGQRKIISLIVAFSANSQVLLLDEPTAHLDEDYRKMVWNYLEENHSDKIIAIGGHDEESKKYCNKFLQYDHDSRNWKKLDSRENFKGKNIEINGELLSGRGPKEKLIDIEDVSYRYPDDTLAIQNLSLGIRKGDIIGIFGGNGSGKTTLVDLIGGRKNPSRGTVERYKDYEISLVMQESEKQLFTDTVEKELKFGVDEKRYNEEVIENLLKKSGLYKRKDFHPYFLSRGEKQILLILSSILHRPDILILDEPFTGLNNKMIERTVGILDEFYQKYGFSIVFTSQEDNTLKNVVRKSVYI